MAAEIALQAQIQGLRLAVESRLAGEQPPSADLPWRPGERIEALVESVRPGDRGFLRIGALLFDARLPPGTAAGQRLDLEFVSATPRPTFALAPAAEPRPPSQAGRSPVDISPAARGLNALVDSVAPQRGSVTAAVGPSAPLLPAPPAEAQPLAAALQRSLQSSGLFYESHLAQWVAGDRPLNALREEPQGRLSPRSPAPDASANPSPGTPDPAAPAPATAAARDGGAQPPAQISTDIIDQRAAPQVRAQVESLDARQVLWQGQPWPGVTMEWRVDEPPEAPHSADDPVPWTSRLKLGFPTLGEVTAELVLSGTQLRVRLHAGDAASRVALQEGHVLLDGALQEARLRLVQFSVDDGG
jgi:hypothetical protein